MPRKPAVEHSLVLEALKKYGKELFHDGKLVSKKDAVWGLVRKELSEKMTEVHLWQYMHENRHDSQAVLRAELKLPMMEEKSCAIEEISEDDETYHPKRTQADMIMPKSTFVLFISAEDWKSFKPQDHRTGLKMQDGWTDLLRSYLWENHRLPCPYVLKTRVNADPSIGAGFVQVEGHCSECQAVALGQIFFPPDDDCDVRMEWYATNTVGQAHSTKSRLQGGRRHEIGQKSAPPSIVHRSLANSLMSHGDKVEPPHLPRSCNIAKAQQEFRDRALNVPKAPSELARIAIMKRTPPWVGSIHDIHLDKVAVFYDTPAQRLIFKTHKKSKYTRLTGDATGGLVQRIPREHFSAGVSAHLFLYELVLDSTFKIPVAQMLSERQDTQHITSWIGDWIRRGADAPDEVVSDSALALLGSFASAFVGCTLKEYVQRQFDFLNGLFPSPAKVYIRKDVSHMVGAVSKWKLWGSNKGLRDFYIRSFALLLIAETKEVFEETLRHILTVANAETIGEDDNGMPVAGENSVNFLAHKFSDPSVYETPKHIDQLVENEIPLPEDIDVDAPVSIRQWVDNIKESAIQDAEQEGNKASTYYNKEVSNKFVTYASDFVLWSGVLVGAYRKTHQTFADEIKVRASSIASEKSFDDLKNRILYQTRRPMQASKFVATHLQSIEGQTKLATASLQADMAPHDSKHHTTSASSSQGPENQKASASSPESTSVAVGSTSSQRSKVLNSVSSNTSRKRTAGLEQGEEDDNTSGNELNAEENWRGLAGVTRSCRKKPKFFSVSTETRLAIENDKIEPPKARLLKNGSSLGAIDLEVATVLLEKTCNIDSLAHLFCTAYLDRPTIRQYMDTATSSFMKLAKSLALHGAVKRTYELRAEAVKKHCQGIDLPTPTTRSKKPKELKKFDCYSKILDVCDMFLGEDTSCTIGVSCKKRRCGGPPAVKKVVVRPVVEILAEEGLSQLSKACTQGILDASPKKCSKCRSQCDINIIEVSSFVLIDLTNNGFGRQKVVGKLKPKQQLQDLPQEISLGAPTKTFHLSAVIALEPMHTVTYCRRLEGSWEKFDNLRNGVLFLGAGELVTPLLLFYVEV